MVERILEQQQALSAVLLEDRKSWCLMLSDVDVTVLEKLVKLLKPLSYLTDALSGEKENLFCHPAFFAACDRNL